MKEDFEPARRKRAPIPTVRIVPENKQVTEAVMPEPFFRLPEEIARVEQQADVSTPPVVTDNTPARKKLHITRKQWVVLSGALAGLLILSSSLYWFVLRKKPAPPAPVAAITEPPKPVEPPKPKTEPSKLTGLEIAPELNQLPITGIMIENSPDARPQAGLKDAGVVVEMLVEGGISRFLALYHESQTDYIGPVRSVRPPFLDFVGAFDAAIAHAGGSGQALAEIRAEGIKDLDHGPNGGSFQRASTRYAPHNLYTSMAQMHALQKAKGYTSTTTPLLRKKEAANPAPTAKVINMSISSYLYNSRWDYDAASNSYLRSMAGKPHTDERSGAQIGAKTVVALVMSHRYAGIYSVYGTTGSGKAYVFQDGVVTEGTWEKAGRTSQIVFKDGTGAALPLNPGLTWMTLVSAPNAVTYGP